MGQRESLEHPPFAEAISLLSPQAKRFFAAINGAIGFAQPTKYVGQCS